MKERINEKTSNVEYENSLFEKSLLNLNISICTTELTDEIISRIENERDRLRREDKLKC